MRDLSICHVKPTQSTAMEQKHLNLLSMSPTLANLWLLLHVVLCMIANLARHEQCTCVRIVHSFQNILE